MAVSALGADLLPLDAAGRPLSRTGPYRLLEAVADFLADRRYDALADAIRDVLSRAIKAGGTTLRDFYGGDGEPGYFKQQLEVYDREGEHCRYCNTVIKAIVQGQRSTYYCSSCQT